MSMSYPNAVITSAVEHPELQMNKPVNRVLGHYVILLSLLCLIDVLFYEDVLVVPRGYEI